jgi:hypothetical protein
MQEEEVFQQPSVSLKTTDPKMNQLFAGKLKNLIVIFIETLSRSVLTFRCESSSLI